MGEFDGKVAIVTGAARGIGYAIAQTLAVAGAAVACNDLDPDALEQSVSRLKADGARVLAVAGSVSEESSAHELVDRCTRELGRLDFLVNNAGVWIIKPLEETTPEEWDRQLATNLRGNYLISRRAIPALRETQGCIVNLASMAGFRFTVPHVAYASSKAGVIAFTRDLAVELAPDRVRVNAIAPGPIDTQGILEGMSARDRERFQEKYLLGRMGQPQDIANAVAFLVSDRASYITGATLPVTGGAELAIRPVM